jgi:hypothetical protein
MWLIELSGDQAAIEQLKKLAELLKWDVAPDHDGRGWLSSGMLDNLSSVEEVREKAIEILTLLNGFARMRSNQFRPVQFLGVSQKRPDGAKAHFISAVFAAQGSFPGGGDLGSTQRLERIADDPNLRKIVEAIGGEITWQRLRVTFERICALVSGRNAKGAWDNALAKHGYATSDELACFKANIEDPRLSGLNSVHGVPSSPAPKGAKMTEEQGLVFVLRLFNTYLDRQLSQAS